MKRYLVFAFVATLLCSCDIREPDFYYDVVNASEDTIYVYTMSDADYFPSQQVALHLLTPLAPGERERSPFWWYWDWSKHSMAVVVFKLQTVKELTWDVIQQRDTIDCLMLYSLEDLKAAKYEILYE